MYVCCILLGFLIQCPFQSDLAINVHHYNNQLTKCYIILLITIAAQIIQPPDNPYTVTFNESTDSVQLMCSLNIDIPSSVTVTWLHNGNLATTTPTNRVLTAGNTTTLVIGNPQPSDAGDYQCGFTELKLQRLINLG